MAEVIDRQTLKALSTDTRQEITRLLSKRPYTASELAKILNKHVTTIAEHLYVLEKSGVVRRKESTNKWVYYTLTDKGEKFFKPYYTWIIALSISIVAFVAGIYEFLFVRFSAGLYSIQAEKAAETAGATAPLATSTTVYDTNIILGILLIIIAIVFLWIALKMKKKR